jgi:hypothetical protein
MLEHLLTPIRVRVAVRTRTRLDVRQLGRVLHQRPPSFGCERRLGVAELHDAKVGEYLAGALRGRNASEPVDDLFERPPRTLADAVAKTWSNFLTRESDQGEALCSVHTEVRRHYTAP